MLEKENSTSLKANEIPFRMDPVTLIEGFGTFGLDLSAHFYIQGIFGSM